MKWKPILKIALVALVTVIIAKKVPFLNQYLQ